MESSILSSQCFTFRLRDAQMSEGNFRLRGEAYIFVMHARQVNPSVKGHEHQLKVLGTNVPSKNSHLRGNASSESAAAGPNSSCI